MVAQHLHRVACVGFDRSHVELGFRTRLVDAHERNAFVAVLFAPGVPLFGHVMANRTTDRPELAEPGAIAPSGLPALDARLGGGFPRGQLSEIVGPRSSGRTSLLRCMLAAATARGELAALILHAQGKSAAATPTSRTGVTGMQAAQPAGPSTTSRAASRADRCRAAGSTKSGSKNGFGSAALAASLALNSLAVLKLRAQQRLRPLLGSGEDGYHYDREVEEFLRRSPSVQRAPAAQAPAGQADEAAPAAGGGAGQDHEDLLYASLGEGELLELIASLAPEALVRLRRYEAAHGRRERVLADLDRRLTRLASKRRG